MGSAERLHALDRTARQIGRWPVGEHADDQIRRDMRASAKRLARADGHELDDDDDEGQVDYYRAQDAARQEARREQLAAANSEMAATTAALSELGLTLERQRSEYHCHIVRHEGGRRTLIAQWWPSSGTAMTAAGKRQRCTTGKALVAWLRDLQKAEAGHAT